MQIDICPILEAIVDLLKQFKNQIITMREKLDALEDNDKTTIGFTIPQLLITVPVAWGILTCFEDAHDHICIINSYKPYMDPLQDRKIWTEFTKDFCTFLRKIQIFFRGKEGSSALV